VGNPAEETYCYPNALKVINRPAFVNLISVIAQFRLRTVVERVAQYVRLAPAWLREAAKLSSGQCRIASHWPAQQRFAELRVGEAHTPLKQAVPEGFACMSPGTRRRLHSARRSGGASAWRRPANSELVVTLAPGGRF
jgi:hypothetical protein